MTLTNELEAIGRIIGAIKTYRHQATTDQDLIHKDLMAIYLKQHLLADDWLLWHRLQGDATLDLPTPGGPGQISLASFEWLLDRYKTAGYALIQAWRQAQNTP